MVLYRLKWAEIRSAYEATMESYRNAPKSESFDSGNYRLPRRFVLTAVVLLAVLLMLVACNLLGVPHLWSVWFSEPRKYEDSGSG